MNRAALIFDLDGTLIDSRRDLATSVNAMRAHFGLTPLDVDTITGFVGDGVRMLVTRAVAGLGIDVEEALHVQGPLYRAHLLDETTLYPGVAEGLRALHAAGHGLGVATNKPADAAETILRHFGIRGLFCEVLGGGSTPNLKPHPDMVVRIMRSCGTAPENTWVVGDNYTDIEAAQRAGVRSVYAAYGFGNLRAAPPTLTVASFADLTRHFLDSGLRREG